MIPGPRPSRTTWTNFPLLPKADANSGSNSAFRGSLKPHSSVLLFSFVFAFLRAVWPGHDLDKIRGSAWEALLRAHVKLRAIASQRIVRWEGGTIQPGCDTKSCAKAS